MRILLLFFVFSLLGCTKKEETVYQIGIDESFFPLDLDGLGPNVYAFSSELIEEISKNSGTPLKQNRMSWDNLIESLYLKKNQGVLSIAPPNLINSTKFSFSKPYLMTGPVLIIPKGSNKTSLNDFAGRTIAMGKTNEEIDLIKNYPDVEFVYYQSYIEALEGTESGTYAACLIPILPAHAYTKDLFQNSLKIASSPLTDQALRLLTLKDMEDQLLTLFNKALTDLQKTDAYEGLLTKWSLYQN